MHQKTKRQCNTHSETNYKITTAIFLTWHRTFKEKIWLEPGFVTSQTSRFFDSVKYTTKMTTLHDRNTVQINPRTFRTEKCTNKQYNSTF